MLSLHQSGLLSLSALVLCAASLSGCAVDSTSNGEADVNEDVGEAGSALDGAGFSS